MPKRARKEPQDVNQWAHDIVKRSTAEPTDEPVKLHPSLISQVMTELGRKGGKKGGKNRMAMLTPEERSQLGTKAVRARWARQRRAS